MRINFNYSIKLNLIYTTNQDYIMLEHYSSYPSPTGHEAADEIVSDIICSKTNMYLISFTKKDEKKIYDVAYNIISNNPPMYSLTAWYMGGKQEYVDMVINTIINKNKKAKSSKRKIRAIIKTLGFLYRIYRITQERMYAPGGKFEIESSLIWNPILKNPNTPPRPPFS